MVVLQLWTLLLEVFTPRNFCSRLYSIEVEFYFFKRKIVEPPILVLRGNVRTPSIARWKARGRLYICHDLIFFAISYGWHVISGNLSKSAFFEGVGHFQWIFWVEGDNSQQPNWSGKTSNIPVSYGVEMLTDDYYVLSQYTHLTDRQTDRQNDDSNTVRCITCSRTVKMISAVFIVSACCVVRYLLCVGTVVAQ